MYTIQQSMIEFLQHCKIEKNLSPSTIKAYRIDLTQLTEFLISKNHSIEITEITKIELREFLDFISRLKVKSIKRKVATIKAMFNYLEFEDKVIINPFRKMKIHLKESKRLPKVLGIQEVKKLFHSAYKTMSTISKSESYKFFESLRNIVVLELLFATGARVSEISNLNIENLLISSGTITIKGKGNKERLIQICNNETMKVLHEYYTLYKKKMNEAGGYFLVNRFGKKLSDQSIRTIVYLLAKRANIQKKITPHIFRHSFATLLLENDVDIKYIQALLGHSSILTTQIYTHVTQTKQKKILSTKHPRKSFTCSGI